MNTLVLTLADASCQCVSIPCCGTRAYFIRSLAICRRGRCEITVTSWYLENTRGRGRGCSLSNFLSFSRHINMPITTSQPCSSVMAFQNCCYQTCGVKKCQNLLSDQLSEGQKCVSHTYFKMHTFFFCWESVFNAHRKSPKNCHWVNCTYYANMLHLNCNHNRQGPSGSDDRCQPLIINVSSEKSAVPAAQPHSGLDFSSRHKPTFIFSLVACNHCVKLCCQRVIFQKWFLIDDPCNEGVQGNRHTEMFIKRIRAKQGGF